MKKRRILAIMMSVIMGIGMLAGCGKKEAEGGSEKTEENSEKKEGTSKKTDGEKKQITMWFWGAATDYQETMKNVLYSWYNDSQDEYELVLEFRNTVDTDIPVALAAGNGPDIVYASGPSYTSKYVEEDLVLNLDDYAEQYGWKDRWTGAYIRAPEECAWEGFIIIRNSLKNRDGNRRLHGTR